MGKFIDVDALRRPPTEVEIGDLLSVLKELDDSEYAPSVVLRRLLFLCDGYKKALEEISHHSVCCDARHTADKVLK